MQKTTKRIHESLFQSSPNAYLVLTPELIVVDANSAHMLLSGHERGAFVGKAFADVFSVRYEEEREQLLSSFGRVVDRGVKDTIKIRYQPSSQVAPDECKRHWRMVNVPIVDDEGQLAFILSHVTDITELKAEASASSERTAGAAADSARVAREMKSLASERRRLRGLMEQAPGFVAVGRGPNFVFELANKAYLQLVGHRDILGKPVREALPELAGQGFYELLDQVYSSGEAFVGRAMPIEFQLQANAQPVTRYIDFIYQPILEPDNSVSGIFVQGHDVTEAHELSRELSYQATHDCLTGLCNRAEFERRLQQAITSLPDSKVHSLLYLDLDQFKLINDTCGHHAGDEFLRLISMVLSARVRPTDTLARLGGDEFGLLLEACPQPAAERIANELREAIADLEFIWQGRVFGGSVSIGLVSIRDESLGLNDALSIADSACFLAKEKGRNRIQVYQHKDDELASRWREMDVIGELRTALKEDRFELYWQRIQPLAAVVGHTDYYEILLRLRHADGHLVPPMAFIPAAERYGLMPAIDRHVIRKVFEFLAGRKTEKQIPPQLSINLSGTSLNDDALVPFIVEMMEQFAIDPTRVCFEITETAAVADLSKTTDRIEELKTFGFCFALDDFGRGMSSLSYLKFLPVDYLKIDGVFIRNILDDKVDAAMVEAIAKVAKVMGLRTVAEYVENEAVRALLVGMGVDYGQGYGIHKPEPLS